MEAQNTDTISLLFSFISVCIIFHHIKAVVVKEKLIIIKKVGKSEDKRMLYLSKSVRYFRPKVILMVFFFGPRTLCNTNVLITF